MFPNVAADRVARTVGVWPWETPDWLPPLTKPSNSRKHTCFQKKTVLGKHFNEHSLQKFLLQRALARSVACWEKRLNKSPSWSVWLDLGQSLLPV